MTSTPGNCSPSRATGFTLIEVLVVVAIIGLMLGVAVPTVRSVARSDLRSAASRTAGLMRFAFDRAITTGDTLRAMFDFDKGIISLEASQGRVSLRKGRQQHTTDDESEAETSEEQASAVAPRLPFGLGGDDEQGDEGAFPAVDAEAFKAAFERDLQPVERPKALFRPLKKRQLKLAERVRIDAVATPRLTKEVTDGRVGLHFFPMGHAEPAVVYLRDKSDEVYSVVIHPLTGRTQVYACRYRLPADFGRAGFRQRRSRSDEEPCEAQD